MSGRHRRPLTGVSLDAQVSRWGRPSRMIKSIQYGTVTIGTGGGPLTATATIAAVVAANAVVHWFGESVEVAGVGTHGLNESLSSVVITNPTTVTAQWGVNGGSNYATVEFMVVEYDPHVVKSNQAFSVAITNTNASATATITAVNLAESIIAFGGFYTEGTVPLNAFATLKQTNATTVTGTRVGTSGALTLNGAVLELAA
ncbi:MAG: hypothetical protein LAO77_24160 [Acidobacteriia bacterium]|nr:hypothetical protein [Terriglobia bacterium]